MTSAETPAPIPAGARTSPAALRNREPILEVLRAHLPASGMVLEVAAGTGEHAAFFAAGLPALTWQPTDPDPEALCSIAAWRDQAGLANLRAPLAFDVADPAAWPSAPVAAVVNINMIHISPWTAAQGLMAGAGRVLAPGSPLCLYGPFIEDGVETAPSNLAFDESLKSRDPSWGLRRLEDVAALAERHGLKLEARLAMPANNLSLVFRKG